MCYYLNSKPYPFLLTIETAVLAASMKNEPFNLNYNPSSTLKYLKTLSFTEI